MVFWRLILKFSSIFLFVFSLFFSLALRGEGLPRKAVNLKTLKVDLSTEYGPLLTEIHFDQQNHDLALRVEEIIRQDLLRVINYFQFTPKEIVHFNIDPYFLLNNGFATVFPQSVIHLFNHPPVQRDHLIVMDDWLRGLIFHEFVHIVHLTQTRDYLKVGQNIFGTIAKVPAGLVPRWFTEGVAVWAESFLIGPGRLQNMTFRNELKSFLKKSDSCQTIDCLDEPGDYPGGQLAYWAGGHFLDFLEKKKSGTVKCLVEYNSSSIPFFLNNAFLDCAGEKAQVLFYKFREQILSEDFKPQNAKVVSPYFGVDNIQKGVVLHAGKIFKIERKRRMEVLAGLNLNAGDSTLTSLPHFPRTFSVPVASLVGIVEGFKPSHVDSSVGKKYLLASFFKDPDFRRENRWWKLISIEDGSSSEDIDLNCSSMPLYVQPGTRPGEFITASYKNNQWMISKENCQEGSAGEVLLTLNRHANLVYFEKKGDQFIFQVEDRGVNRVYAALENFQKQVVLYEYKTSETITNSAKSTIELPVIGKNFLVVRQINRESTNVSGHGKLQLIEWNQDFSKVFVSNIKNPSALPIRLDQVSFVLIDSEKENVVGVLDSLYVLANTPKEFLSKLAAVKSETQEFNKTSEAQAATNNSNSSLEKYPSWSHLTPHWWFFTTGTGENINSFGAMTSVADPMQVHSANMSLVFYEKYKLGGDFNYQQKLVKVSDLWDVNAFFRKEYYKNDLSVKISSSQDQVLGTQYLLLLRKWTMAPGLFVAYKKNEDFISNRSVYSMGLGLDAFYGAQSYSDFFQNLVFRSKFQIDDSSLGNKFLNMQFKLDVTGKLYEDLDIGVNTAYGKLVKSGFLDGVIYGGGDQILLNRWYNFYGIPYSNIYGNEIFVFKTFLDFNALNVYRGHGFVPFFFKELHLLLGHQTLKADRIYLNRTLLANRTLHGFYVGPRFKLNLFYYIPTDIDVIFSSIKHPNGNNVNGTSLILTADFF